jgi:hypothetical protein
MMILVFFKEEEALFKVEKKKQFENWESQPLIQKPAWVLQEQREG